MTSSFHEQDVGTIIEHVLGATDGETVFVNPTPAAIARLVAVMDAEEDDAVVTVLAEEGTIKPVMGDFLVASAAADLIADERLSLQVTEDLPPTVLLVTDGMVVAVVAAGEMVAGLTSEDEAFVESVRERYAETAEESDRFKLRTPPISRVQETLADELGPDVAADFERVLASLETARGDGDGLDEVTISLLVAAKNELLLYDISKWGEDVGVASKATFSRTKTSLEDMGLLDTKKVPIDVGRPRLRLLLGDDRLRGVDADELAAVAQGLLSGSLESET